MGKHTQQNSQFQRIAMKDKKAFFTENAKQRKTKEQEIQENWRYQGNINAKMGTIMDRNSKYLTEPEETKRWQG